MEWLSKLPMEALLRRTTSWWASIPSSYTLALRSKVLRKVSMKQQSGHCTASTHACSDKWRLAALCVFSLPFHFRFLIIKSPSHNERKSQQLPIANLFLLYACMMYGGGGGGAQCSVISAIQHVEYPPKNI